MSRQRILKSLQKVHFLRLCTKNTKKSTVKLLLKAKDTDTCAKSVQIVQKTILKTVKKEHEKRVDKTE